jgi:hypothetical protein
MGVNLPKMLNHPLASTAVKLVHVDPCAGGSHTS